MVFIPHIFPDSVDSKCRIRPRSLEHLKHFFHFPVCVRLLILILLLLNSHLRRMYTMYFQICSNGCFQNLRGGWTKAWLAREKEKGLIQALDVRRFKERVCEKLFQWPSSSHLCSKHLLQRVATFSLTCSTIAVLMRQPNAIVPGGDMPFIRFTSVHFGSTHSFLANKRWWWWWWRWWWWRWWWGWWWRRIRSGSARARREGHQI